MDSQKGGLTIINKKTQLTTGSLKNTDEAWNILSNFLIDFLLEQEYWKGEFNSEDNRNSGGFTKDV